MVAGAGTGGTVTGLSRAIKKKHNPACIVVGLDPKGSILAYPDTLNDPKDTNVPYVVEGIGYDFIPDVLGRNEIDVWLKSEDQESFDAVKMLMKKEGLLVGGSSGTALAGALRWLKDTEQGRKISQEPGKNVVVLLPDGIRNYMSKPWFLKIAMESEPTPLSDTIAKILNKPEPKAKPSSSVQTSARL